MEDMARKLRHADERSGGHAGQLPMENGDAGD
jgi:hypothetical protein